MRITLTRDLGPHRKGSSHDVTPAVAARLIRKGNAKQPTRQGTSDGDTESTPES